MEFIDLKKQYLIYKTDIDQAINAILDQTNFVNGKEVELLEQKIADYVGTKYAVSCNSGTDALKLALMSLQFEPGSEIITTPFTFIATCEVIEELGYKTVFVDIDPKTFNIDTKKIEQAITNKTKAIIPVHLFGEVANMDDLSAIAKKYKLAMIEDCAQAFGSECTHGKVGSIGDLGAHSFFPTKNLGGYGDGGLITTNDQTKYEYIKAKKNHGQRVKYIHDDIGLSSRLDTIQASVLLAKFKHIDEEIALRKEKFDYYLEKLQGIDGINFQENAYGTPVHNMFNMVCEKRDELQSYLKEKGIPTMIYYPLPMHLQKYFVDKYGYKVGDFPHAEKVSQQILAIPFYPYMKREDQDEVIQLIREFFGLIRFN